jgi:glutamate-ammonia-ligase adenylyltransferase
VVKGARLSTSVGRLARLGFRDADAGLAALRPLGTAIDEAVHHFGAAADPDQAAGYLADLVEAAGDGDELLDILGSDEDFALRLVLLLGASSALAQHLVRNPEQWHDLTDPVLGTTRAPAFAMRADLLRAVGADPADEAPVAGLEDSDAVDALRVEYRRLLLHLAARDLAHGVGVDDVAAELSDLAAGTLEAALAVARARVGEAASTCRLAVIAMGKCGGHELNYVSDVDVIFVAEPVGDTAETPALRAATQLASNLMRICSEGSPGRWCGR